MSFRWHIDNSELIALNIAFDTVPRRVAAQLTTKTRFWGQMLLTKVKANASTGHHKPGEPHIPGTGPGPNVATGDYLRSWGLDMEIRLLSVSAIVGTNAPQGRRLEWGFIGTDSAGRHVHAPPYPHVGPALDWVAPQFVADLERIDLLGV